MKRAAHLSELMDNRDADPHTLDNTYRQFRHVNQFFSGWKHIFRKVLHPILLAQDRAGTMLDMGAGGGDIPIELASLAKKHRIQLAITAIDPDERAAAFFKKTHPHSAIDYRTMDDRALAATAERFDIITSNHLIHHLAPDEVTALCERTANRCNRLVLFNDLRRSRIALLLYALTMRLFFRNSFVWEDGCRSIRRAYTPAELRQLAPEGWQVERKFPFRLWLRYERPDL